MVFHFSQEDLSLHNTVFAYTIWSNACRMSFTSLIARYFKLDMVEILDVTKLLVAPTILDIDVALTTFAAFFLKIFLHVYFFTILAILFKST